LWQNCGVRYFFLASFARFPTICFYYTKCNKRAGMLKNKINFPFGQWNCAFMSYNVIESCVLFFLKIQWISIKSKSSINDIFSTIQKGHFNKFVKIMRNHETKTMQFTLSWFFFLPYFISYSFPLPFYLFIIIIYIFPIREENERNHFTYIFH
jgi:hypothetical protein